MHFMNKKNKMKFIDEETGIVNNKIIFLILLITFIITVVCGIGFFIIKVVSSDFFLGMSIVSGIRVLKSIIFNTAIIILLMFECLELFKDRKSKNITFVTNALLITIFISAIINFRMIIFLNGIFEFLSGNILYGPISLIPSIATIAGIVIYIIIIFSKTQNRKNLKNLIIFGNALLIIPQILNNLINFWDMGMFREVFRHSMVWENSFLLIEQVFLPAIIICIFLMSLELILIKDDLGIKMLGVSLILKFVQAFMWKSSIDIIAYIYMLILIFNVFKEMKIDKKCYIEKI